jgi:hypothetical protein
MPGQDCWAEAGKGGIHLLVLRLQKYTTATCCMGVPGLWKLLEPCSRPININKLSGCTLAVGMF